MERSAARMKSELGQSPSDEIVKFLWKSFVAYWCSSISAGKRCRAKG